MDANEYYLNQHLAKLDKQGIRESAIESKADALLEEMLFMLNKTNKTGSDFQTSVGYNMWDALNDIELSELKKLADFFVSGDTLALGDAFYKAIENVLAVRAKEQATEDIENGD